MKTKEELLKIYSAYLPYELDGETIYHNTDDGTERCLLSTKDGLNNFVGIDDWVNQYNYPIKPILYSMDMLTKEIEHKGEIFIPSKRLGFKEVDIITLKAWGEFSGRLLHKDFEQLIEWHLNVFGLDESEYIKKQSVIQK